jgi:hypothetical protein
VVNGTERPERTDDRRRLADLRRQHNAWLREGYDGHNRRGGITTMDRLRERRRRRLVAQWLRDRTWVGMVA